MATIIRWFQNATDPNPVETEFHPEIKWRGGQGIVGLTNEVHDPTFFGRYGNPSPDGAGRIMQGLGPEGLGAFAYPIVKAMNGGREGSWEQLRDLLATYAKGPAGLTHADYVMLVGRPDPDSAPGSQVEGSAQHNPIWIKDWRDPRVSPERRHGDTWVGPDGKYYGLDDRSRGQAIIKQPLGTGESGGETVPTTEQTLSVQGRLELIERQLAELLAMLRKEGRP